MSAPTSATARPDLRMTTAIDRPEEIAKRRVRQLIWTYLWLLLIPMGLLMALQFQASPDSFINRTAGLGEAEQLTAGGGKIRPPGPFSFVSGPVYYMSLATAFLIYGALRRGIYKNWLLIAAV